MKSISILRNLCTILFVTGIVSSYLVLPGEANRIFPIVLLTVSLIYLFTGWFFFKGYNPEGHPLLLFLSGYLYAGIFIAFSFYAFGWPLNETFIYMAPFWSLIQIVMTTVIKSKLSKGSFIQFLIEGSLLLVLSVAALIKII
jgi:hypothetical protein